MYKSILGQIIERDEEEYPYYTYGQKYMRVGKYNRVFSLMIINNWFYEFLYF